MDTQTVFNEVLGTLESVPFPADKTAMVNGARQHCASEEIQNLFQTLPEGRMFKSVQDVVSALQLKAL